MSFKLQMSQVEEKRNLQSEQTYNTFSSEHEGPAQRFLFWYKRDKSFTKPE